MSKYTNKQNFLAMFNFQQSALKSISKNLNNFQNNNYYFSILHSFISILESNEMLNVSPPQTSLYAIVKQEINLYSQFLDSFCETLTDSELSQKVKFDLQRILAWFIMDHFVLNLDLISTARKSFRPQTSDDGTI